MPRKKLPSARVVILSRYIDVTSLEASVRIQAVERRGECPRIETQPWLEIHGTMDEPVRNVSAAVVNLLPGDRREPGPARPACVGAIVAFRPELSMVVHLPWPEYELLFQVAMSSLLREIHFSFSKPFRNHSLVTALSVSTKTSDGD